MRDYKDIEIHISELEKILLSDSGAHPHGDQPETPLPSGGPSNLNDYYEDKIY